MRKTIIVISTLLIWCGCTTLRAQNRPSYPLLPDAVPHSTIPLQSTQALTSQTVVSSLHNLAPSQSGNTSLACIYCHASHNTITPVKGLWNHDLSSASYSYYGSSTYTQGAPSVSAASSSRACMSCHDGTVALGETKNYRSTTSVVRTQLSATGNMGVDLSASHPFAFDQWNKDTSLVDTLFNSSRTTGNPKVKLNTGRIECGTCHDPHLQNLDPARQSDFLVINNQYGAICLACHDATKSSPATLAGWAASAHAVSTSTEDKAVTGYPTVAGGACGNCHAMHRSSAARLLSGADEQTCYPCHANPNSSNRWGKVWIGYNQHNYRHPVENTGHDPNENLLGQNTSRHSKCWDCHNSHAALNNTKSTETSLSYALVGATGITSDGTSIAQATLEYQVCFKCHGDSLNKPQKAGYTDYGYTPVRSISAFNVRDDFNSPIARHNVVRPFSGVVSPDLRDNVLMLNNTSGRSLKASGSYLQCSDCHNGENPSLDGGTGPNGPHISGNAHILERPYALNQPANPGQAVQSLAVTLDPLTGTFAMCEKCHDVSGLLGSGTGAGPKDTIFKHHGTHVLKMGISCSVCHAPHGVSNGTKQFNAHSINLDAQLTSPDPKTQRWYIDTANQTCYVSCHFTNDQGTPVAHSGVSYNTSNSARAQNLRRATVKKR